MDAPTASGLTARTGWSLNDHPGASRHPSSLRRGILALILLIAIPANAKISRERLSALDEVINRAIANKEAPGAVVLVGHKGDVVYRKAYGQRAIEPARAAMTEDTIFDMASLTKVVATTTSIMILVEEGKIGLAEPIAKYVPEFGTLGKERITFRDVMTHHSGLPAGSLLDADIEGYDEIITTIAKESLINPVGDKFVYSDLGYVMLAEVVRRVSGMPLDRFASERIFRPLGMKETGFKPARELRNRIAPTEPRNGVFTPGEVHDPRAYRMGGVSGHAGLFSTADDLSIFCQMLLNAGEYKGARILSPASVRLLGTPQSPVHSPDRRGLGWDIDSPLATNRGDLFALPSFGHTGFTGTSIWIDPSSQTYVILLSNRVHPDGKGDVVRLRARVASVVAAAVEDYVAAPAPTSFQTVGTVSDRPGDRRSPPQQVKTGADLLIQRGLPLLENKRIGVISNHTTVLSDGRRLVDAMLASKRFNVVALFSPEHGPEGTANSAVDSQTDKATGLPIHSLYGSTRRPTPEMLRGIDALVFDIQDIGVRFYTYVTTMAYAMEEAVKAGIPIVVLDRPNPINGLDVDGPMLDADLTSFVGYMPMPTRHGMTVGELAAMFNAEKKIGAKLAVVKMEGWDRSTWYDQTGLVWINPSPNMTGLDAAALYPGIGTIENSLSVGRGTNSPFEKVGAPYIEPAAFARELNALKLEGVRFVPIRFTPAGEQQCGGVQIITTDRTRMKPLNVGIAIASTLYRMYPTQYPIDKILSLLGNRRVLQDMKAGKQPAWQSELQPFRRLRQQYLLY